MKKALFLVAAALLMPQVGFGQATILFKTADINVPYYPRVTDPLGQARGPDFFGQLWVGPADETLSAVGSPVRFTFYDGALNPAAAGAIDAGEAQVTATGDSFTADIRLYAWDAAHATFAAAATAGAHYGISATMRGELGGTTANGSVIQPPDLVSLGFQSFPAPLPEPRTIALGILGLTGLVAAKRRHFLS